MLIALDISQNYTIPNFTYSQYEYAGSIRTPGEDRSSARGMTSLKPVPSSTTISDPYDFGVDLSEYDLVTKTFYLGWYSTYIFRDASIDTLLSKTQLDIVDASEYVVVEDMGENGKSYSQDSDSACENGSVIKTIELTYSKE